MPLLIETDGSFTGSIDPNSLIRANDYKKLIEEEVEKYFIGKPHAQRIVYKINEMRISDVITLKYSNLSNQTKCETSVQFRFDGISLVNGTLFAGTVKEVTSSKTGDDTKQTMSVIETHIKKCNTYIRVDMQNALQKKNELVYYYAYRGIESLAMNLNTVVLLESNIKICDGFRGRCPYTFAINRSAITSDKLAAINTYINCVKTTNEKNAEISQAISKKMNLTTKGITFKKFADILENGKTDVVQVKRVGVPFAADEVEVSEVKVADKESILVSPENVFAVLYDAYLLESDDTSVFDAEAVKKLNSMTAWSSMLI